MKYKNKVKIEFYFATHSIKEMEMEDFQAGRNEESKNKNNAVMNS